MSSCFSITYMKQLEPHLDLNMGLLRRKIQAHCDSREPFDLKELIHFYIIDVLGELAFGQSFGVQIADDKNLAPPVVEHSLLAAATGAWPLMTSSLKKWLPLVPYTPLRKLFQGRARVAQIASESVQRRLEEVATMEKLNHNGDSTRKDILSDLIAARNSDTGASLSQSDLETEAFGYIIAGTHTTSATTAFLLYHLLHSPKSLRRVVSELDANLPDLQHHQESYAFSALESSLPFTRDCIKENFRLTPVFTMPLARRVIQPEGVFIGERHLPAGVSMAPPSGRHQY
jgi:cytochrome P450